MGGREIQAGRRRVVLVTGVALEGEIKSKVCKSCWKEWEGMRVMVINEYQINLGEESGRELIKKHMRSFLNLGDQVDTSLVKERYKPVQ